MSEITPVFAALLLFLITTGFLTYHITYNVTSLHHKILWQILTGIVVTIAFSVVSLFVMEDTFNSILLLVILTLLICTLALMSYTLKSCKFVLDSEEKKTCANLGIFTEKHLNKRLAEEYSRAQRHNIDLSVLLVEVDLTHSIRKMFGAETAVTIQKEVIHYLIDEVRTSDVVCLFQEDIYCIILPHTNEVGAQILAERMHATLNSRAVNYKNPTANNKGVLFLNCCMAGTATSPAISNSKALLKSAEKALKKARKAGGSIVIME